MLENGAGAGRQSHGQAGDLAPGFGRPGFGTLGPHAPGGVTAEVAEHLNLAAGTVRNRLVRIRHLLAELLNDLPE